VSLPPAGCTSGSTVPVNDQGRRLHRVQAPLTAAEATDGAELCRRRAGRTEAALETALAARAVECLVLGKAADAQHFPGLGKARQIFVLGGRGGAISSAAASRAAAGCLGFPVVDMIEVSERTRCGNEIAIFLRDQCPPIEAPTRCARL